MRITGQSWGRVVSNQMGWFHMVMVYEGPSGGINIYINGALAGSDNTASDVSHVVASRKTVVGRFYTDLDEKYATIKVDEVTMWNMALTAQDVQDLYNFYGKSHLQCH